MGEAESDTNIAPLGILRSAEQSYEWALVDMMIETMIAKMPRAEARSAREGSCRRWRRGCRDAGGTRSRIKDGGCLNHKDLYEERAFWASTSAHPLPQIPTHTLRTIRVALGDTGQHAAKRRSGSETGGRWTRTPSCHATAYPGPEEGVARGHVKVAVRDECGLRLDMSGFSILVWV